jgi:hypothetical protein
VHHFPQARFWITSELPTIHELRISSSKGDFLRHLIALGLLWP